MAAVSLMTSFLYSFGRQMVSFSQEGVKVCVKLIRYFQHESRIRIESKSDLYPSTLGLPYVTSLQNGTPVIVQVMNETQVTEIHQLLQKAAKLGQGFGINEVGSETEFRLEYQHDYKFVIQNMADGQTLAYFIIGRSPYGRGANVADAILIVPDEHRGQKIGRVSTGIVETLAQRLGFIGIYADPFGSNKVLINLVASAEGYHKVATLPVAGVMPDGSTNTVELYYKSLTADE